MERKEVETVRMREGGMREGVEMKEEENEKR